MAKKKAIMRQLLEESGLNMRQCARVCDVNLTTFRNWIEATPRNVESFLKAFHILSQAAERNYLEDADLLESVMSEVEYSRALARLEEERKE